MSTTFEPLEDRILVRRDDSPERIGSIIVPDMSREKDPPQLATVIAVGMGKVDSEGVHIEPILKVGDRIIFGKYSGTELKIDGEKYTVLREGDVLGIIHES